MTGIVHIVHAIDTEGPLYESIEARFEHLGHRFGISDIEPTESNLGRLLRGEIDLGPQTQTIQEALKNHSTKTLGSGTTPARPSTRRLSSWTTTRLASRSLSNSAMSRMSALPG